MLNWQRLTLVGLCSTVLLIAGCTATESPTKGSATATASPTVTASSRADACRVTRPTKAGIPKGVRETIDGPVFGQGALWVHAWWAEEPTLTWARENNRIKYPSLTTHDGEVTDQLGPPRWQAKQLNGNGEASGDTGGYATTQDDSGKTLHWWPTVIDFSSPGCWQVTETVGYTSISYVIKL